MKTFSAAELKIILKDILIKPINVDICINKINTDTRTLAKGETFVAVSGENFDAHQFVSLAEQSGANAVIVERYQDDIDIPQIVVRNTRFALGLLASSIRSDFMGKVVGLTGSVGKTTNKQMLLSILLLVGHTHATKGNLNNDLGVPFTWFDLPSSSEFAVIEMGANHQGEISYLANITRPNIGMITNAGEAHLEGFGGLDGVAKGKGELIEALKSGDIAVLNIDDSYYSYWLSLINEGVKVLTFSLEQSHADVFAENIVKNASCFTLCYQNQKQLVNLPTVGVHNVMNSLGVAACAIALGVSLEVIAKGLSQFKSEKGRLLRHQRGGSVIIDDTYNANPTSMRASANILEASNGYRIMVIADMGELGENELALHRQLGYDLIKKADTFFCYGSKMRAFVESNPNARHFMDIETLKVELLVLLKSKEQVTTLVKGSRSMKMERVVDYLLDTIR
ncbi:MAG: UDP-N-acetylmuramoyl-tripeptide--D-alanyl-D-alanine ligase [Gammaproteobacteria bacterium]|nr:UDP-N-acetylmuramoyl-tripeptide--D-alanyl-D-alanine ligase [Gammaproteobacteria bacterium]